MQKEINLTVLPGEENNLALLRQKIARKLLTCGLKSPPEKIHFSITKKSLDARKRPVKIVLRCAVFVGEKTAFESFLRQQKALPGWKKAAGSQAVVIVGAGPAGLFAALRLLEAGIKPVIIERGSPSQERRREIAAISRLGVVDSDSNYCFGQGGAGMFSDGKIYTRSNKRGDIGSVLRILAHFGADEKILTAAHPHIGTDRLPQVVSAICAKITDCGGEIFYNTKCTGLLCEQGDAVGSVGPKIVGVEAQGTRTKEKREFLGQAVVLATGHSAADIYALIARIAPNALEAKTFAAGVRVEHPRQTIDTIQFHGENLRGGFPAAEYRLRSQIDGRGVYSFCMCPGGFVVPTATSPEEIVVNGMSAAGRNSRWSNSAIVVEIRPEDVPEKFRDQGALAGLFLRTELEKETFCQAQAESGKGQMAPAQRLSDFLARRESTSLPESSYTPGVVASRLDEWLWPHISGRLARAFVEFDRKMRGFACDDALLIASETRTSTPVRILRNKETRQCVALQNMYPCGEGSGYSGGITSSALDGINAAEQIVRSLGK